MAVPSLCFAHTPKFLCPNLNKTKQKKIIQSSKRTEGRGQLTCFIACRRPPPLLIFNSSCRAAYLADLGAGSLLADGLDGALEAGGGLQLQLVGHGVDLKAIQPGVTGDMGESFSRTLLAQVIST